MCCNTKAPDLHDLFSILLLLPILRLFYPPLLYIITITVLLRILEIEDAMSRFSLFIKVSLAQSHSHWKCPGPRLLTVTVLLSPEPESLSASLAAVVSLSLQGQTAGKPVQADRTTYQPERRNFNK